MAIYAVHSPALDRDPAKAFDRAAALPQGFARWAFAFGPFWLLAKRLWFAFAVWVVAAGAVAFATVEGMLTEPAAGLLFLLGDLYLGFSGRGLQGWAMDRRGAPLADIVGGASVDEAEREFLSRALPGAASAPVAAPRSASVATPPSIIGLFPEAGR